MAVAVNEGILRTPSRHSVDETVDRLRIDLNTPVKSQGGELQLQR